MIRKNRFRPPNRSNPRIKGPDGTIEISRNLFREDPIKSATRTAPETGPADPGPRYTRGHLDLHDLPLPCLIFQQSTLREHRHRSHSDLRLM
ncbi:hypothetical protein H5410_007345 [Solanum commersonii]|uniref:Uncharacterized protein n=1 Tax=Solanum commersonii TaxID=4109 RepID=A0A9J6ADV3_SOLCO|nr:hypothetical protein H5410_007345 [Solanum commersonii]